jgi:hypothetical protein
LAKKSLPATNRKKKIFAGYLAKFMLHCKWKKLDGFKMFMKYAGNLYSGVEKSDYVSQDAKRSKRSCEFNLLYFTLLYFTLLI